MSLVIGRPKFVQPKLQITAMMDMFTIIVFFLLYSYSDKPDELTVDAGINLPQSTASLDYKNSVKLSISKTKVMIEGDKVADIVNDKIVGLNVNQLDKSPLYVRLKKYRQNKSLKIQGSDESLQNVDDPKVPPHVLFFCDKDVPYKVINRVMSIAGMAGYPNLQFAVQET